MAEVRIERWLPLVTKPSRYIDSELNACHKPWQEVNLCLVYPDVYEVGISHLGLKILYSILNGLGGVMADRCYLPWLDLIDIMRREGLPLFGLESQRELRDFDLIGITLQSELTYSNVPELLDLAQIPILAKDRGAVDPLILGGGPCAVNPLPLVPFFDAFFVGEAEEAIGEIAAILLGTKSRSERLLRLAEIKGCFVPSLQLAQINSDWKVKARKHASFAESGLIHAPQLLPWQLATHNRCVAELMRGCSRGCRFCQAGYLYRPVRERPAQTVLQDLLQEIASTGWDEAGLLSLSSSDYSCLPELLLRLYQTLDTNRTHISLPSLRVDALDDRVAELLRDLGREGLTIAPEAGSQRLRDVINKNLSEAQILDGVRIALKLGWQRVKLYFMIGLPTEEDADVSGIIDLIHKIAALGGRRLQINVTLSPFVPKPFTPFQWAGISAGEELLRRCLRVKHAFTGHRRVRIRYHTIESSLLEAFLARGDLAASQVLLSAWQLGARFDGWNECFDFSLWKRAMDEAGLDLLEQLGPRDPSARLPWDFIDIGIRREFLKEEWLSAIAAETAPDCRQTCSQCGICGLDLHTVTAPQPQFPSPMEASKSQLVSHSIAPNDLRLESDIGCRDGKRPYTVDAPGASTARQYRYRFHYSRTGMLRFISHLDWMRMLFRLISQIPIETVYSQGFSPHPKVSLCPPLPLGVESACDYFDLSLQRAYLPEELPDAWSRIIIPGFRIQRSERLDGKPSQPQSELIEAVLPPEHLDHARVRLQALLSQQTHPFTKSTPTRSQSYDLRRIVLAASWQDQRLVLQKSLASPALYDVLAEVLGLDKSTLYSCQITRRDWGF